MKIKLLLFGLLFLTFTTCLSAKFNRFEGKYKVDLLNKVGNPSHIIIKDTEQVYIYFFQDYSQAHYPNKIFSVYISNSTKIVTKITKTTSRLDLDEFVKVNF